MRNDGFDTGSRCPASECAEGVYCPHEYQRMQPEVETLVRLARENGFAAATVQEAVRRAGKLERKLSNTVDELVRVERDRDMFRDQATNMAKQRNELESIAEKLQKRLKPKKLVKKVTKKGK